MSTITQSSVAEQFGMKEALQLLGIKELNEGTSTGSEWFSNGEIIESYSPVDGQLIGSSSSIEKLVPVTLIFEPALIAMPSLLIDSRK